MTDAVTVLLILAGAIVGIIRLGRHRDQQRLVAEGHRRQGQLNHVRGGEYPSSCSWCKNTALARTLLVFERSDDTWVPCDLLGRLRACADAEVLPLASALTSEQPRYRRFCTERCTSEFLKAENVPSAAPFVTCDYCSVRFPLALLRCHHCGAAKASGATAR